MLDMFKKHLSYVGLELELEHVPCEKYGYRFSDANTQKHYLSFYATYSAGFKAGVKKSVETLQGLGK